MPSTPSLARGRATACLVALLAGGGLASAQAPGGVFHDAPPPPPATPAGKRLLQVIDTINTADEAKIRALIVDGYVPSFRDDSPYEAHAGFLRGVREGNGRLTLVAVRNYEPPLPDTEIVGIVKTARTERWLGIRLGVETAAPHRLVQFTVMPARPPEMGTAATTLTVAQLAAELDAYLERLTARGAFTGAVLVARGDEVLFEKAYGEAHRGFHAPNRTDTLFGLASMGKMFTAVAVAQLVEQGKIALDDPVAAHVPSAWLPDDPGRKITVRQLLAHTSGLGDFLAHPMFVEGSKARFRAIADYRPLVAGSTPAFEPGTGWQYSNAGYLLLGALIEKVAGLPYPDYLRTRVWEPAGMVRTGCYDADVDVENLALGYSAETTGSGTIYRANLYEHSIRGTSAGGCYSTVGELHRFARALVGGKLVGKDLLEEMWTATEASKGRFPYGLGFDVAGGPGARVVGHAGNFSGVSGGLDIYLDAGFVVAVLGNGDGVAGPARDKARELISRLERK